MPSKDDTLENLSASASASVAKVLSDCQGLNQFSDSLLDLLRDLAEKAQLKERDNLLSRLESWILDAQNAGGGRVKYLRRVKNLSLQAFGSSVMGISARGGDLDISLEGQIRDEGISPSGYLTDASRNFRRELLGEVHACLRNGNHFRGTKHTQLIRRAKVPVSKFVEQGTGIHCDLSIGNTTGVFKSQLLAEVLKIDSRVRNLVVFVKKWAKANNMNDPTTGSFNSYCLTLLVIAFAQTRSPPLLPPFKDLFPGLRTAVSESGKAGTPSLVSLIDKYRETANAWAENHAQNGEKNEETLCELLLAFLVTLSLYATHSQLMHYTAEGVSKSTIRPTASPWDGGIVCVSWEAKALKKYQLFVEDPFEAKDNCARTLATQDWWRICKTLQETVQAIQDFLHANNRQKCQKWRELWFLLFQKGPSMREFVPQEDARRYKSEQERSALMLLHREALLEHLKRFKVSDKRFIAVSDSWWSREFKTYVMQAVEDFSLFRGDGPKKKLLISKDSDIKEALVEHAVNSTLRARKNQNTIIDPYDCVVKQRLREFLKCTLRQHVFRASAFERDVKDWVLTCVEMVGLLGSFLSNGDLRVERPVDMRPSAFGMQHHHHHHPHNGIPPGYVKTSSVVVNGMRAGESTAECTGDGCMEAKENGVAGFSEREDTPGTDVGESEGELGECGWTENEVEGTPEVEDVFQLEDSATDREADLGVSTGEEYTAQELGRSDSGFGGWVDDRVKVALVVVDEGVEVRFSVVRPGLALGSGGGGSGECSSLSEEAGKKVGEVTVQVVSSVQGDRVCMSLNVVEKGGRGAEQSSNEADDAGSISDESIDNDMDKNSEDGHEKKSEGSGVNPPSGSPSKLNPEQHQRNGSILRLVFFDLYAQLERLKLSNSMLDEVQIDPTEFIVPVAWVRQQVRDIARNLFLEVLPMTGKKRRAMKIRVRRPSQFDNSDSDMEDYSRHPFRCSPPKRQPRMQDRRDMMRMPMDYPNSMNMNMGMGGMMPRSSMEEDHKDHVSNCLLWVKKQKRPFEFWTDVYPPNVQQGIRDRAEDMGLGVSVEGNKMYVGLDMQMRRPLRDQRNRPMPLHVLNDEVQIALQNYLEHRMRQMLMHGQDRITIPSKGFVMRPTWVVEEAVRIAREYGLEVIDQKDQIDIVNSNRMAQQRQHILRLFQQSGLANQHANHHTHNAFSAPGSVPLTGQSTMYSAQDMLQSSLSASQSLPQQLQDVHVSNRTVVSPAAGILQLGHQAQVSSSFSHQPDPAILSLNQQDALLSLRSCEQPASRGTPPMMIPNSGSSYSYGNRGQEVGQPGVGQSPGEPHRREGKPGGGKWNGRKQQGSRSRNNRRRFDDDGGGGGGRGRRGRGSGRQPRH